MKRRAALFGGIFLAVLSFGISTIAAFRIAELYFFDSLIYQKSLLHGYGRIVDDLMPLYGRRSRDLRELSRRSLYGQHKPVLGKTTQSEVFTIAVIGDSYVWGRGVTNDSLVSVQLEKQLAAVRPVRVLTFGYPGDSVIDYLKRYREVRDQFSVDLFVIMLSPNDMYAPTNISDYDGILIGCEGRYPGEPVLYPYDTSREIEQGIPAVNICQAEEALAKLPNLNALYFVMSFRKTPGLSDRTFTDMLARQGKTVVTARDHPMYKEYWQSPEQYFYVSAREPHASAIAHRMMADVLADIIIKNPSFRKEDTE